MCGHLQSLKRRYYLNEDLAMRPGTVPIMQSSSVVWGSLNFCMLLIDASDVEVMAKHFSNHHQRVEGAFIFVFVATQIFTLDWFAPRIDDVCHYCSELILRMSRYAVVQLKAVTRTLKSDAMNNIPMTQASDPCIYEPFLPRSTRIETCSATLCIVSARSSLVFLLLTGAVDTIHVFHLRSEVGNTSWWCPHYDDKENHEKPLR